MFQFLNRSFQPAADLDDFPVNTAADQQYLVELRSHVETNPTFAIPQQGLAALFSWLECNVQLGDGGWAGPTPVGAAASTALWSKGLTASSAEDELAASVVGVSASSNAYINAVVAGYGKWSGQLTYSFPSSTTAYNNSYAVAIDGFQQVSATQKTAVQAILETGYGSFEAVCSLDIVQVADNTVRGSVNLQIAQCDNFNGANLSTARVADFPGSPIFPSFPDAAGDVWFGDDSGNGTDDGLQGYRTPVMGNYAYATHIHELGHALGLQHSHDATGTTGFGVALPAGRRDVEFSIMSYLSYDSASSTGGYSNEQFGYPTTLMMYDILALQYLYGADYNTNSGNTVYTWSPTTGQMFINGVGQGTPGANRIFLTIWDGGGTDTYDMSNYTNGVSIDLRPEMWSVTSTAQLADLDRNSTDPTRVAQGNVYNAALFNGDTRSLIENAVGGSGNDTIRGNSANNSIDGGAGTDTAVFSANRSAYTLTDLGGGSVRVTGPDGTDTLTRVEFLRFADQTIAWTSTPTTDDFRNSLNDTSHPFGTVAVNGSSTGTLEVIGDHDWFQVQLVAGTQYTFNERGSGSSNGTLQDPYMVLRDSAGNQLAFNDDSNGTLDSQIVFTATYTGTYYIDAGAYLDQVSGSYRVSVTGANHAPVVTANAANVTATAGQSFTASSLFSVSDSDAGDILTYYLYDATAGGGHWVVNGNTVADQTVVAISASQFAQARYVAGSSGASDTVSLLVYDGHDYSGANPSFTQTHVNVPGVNHAPVVTANAANVAATAGQSIAATSLFSVSDSDPSDILTYYLYDATAGGGHWVVNGNTVADQTVVAISASQFAQARYVAGASGASDTVSLLVYDGHDYSGANPSFTQTHVNVAGVNHAPVVTANAANVSASAGQSITASSLFSVSDSDAGDILTYYLYDATAGASSGHWVVNGTVIADQTVVAISANQFAQTRFVAGTGGSNDDVRLLVYDGHTYSGNTTFTSTHVIVPPAGQTVSSLFSASDVNGGILSFFRFDATPAASGGDWLVNCNSVAADAVTEFANQFAQNAFTGAGVGSHDLPGLVHDSHDNSGHIGLGHFQFLV